MYIYVDDGFKIFGCLQDFGTTREMEESAKKLGAIEYSGEFEFKEGFDAYYIDGEIVYREIPPIEPTETEQLQSALKTLLGG